MPLMVTAAERRLRSAYRNGSLLDLTGAARTVIRAEFLSGLLLDGPGAAGGRTARVDLAGAHITGRLDLTGARLAAPLRLRHCVFDEQVLFDHADLVSLNLDGSVLPGIRLASARIGGDLSLSDARIGPSGDWAAVAGSGLHVVGALLAHRLHTDGGINLIGAQLGGGAAFNNCVLRCPAGYALLLIEAQARLLTLRPAGGSAGTVSLRDAHFGRVVDDPVTWPANCRIELDGLTYDRLTRRSEDVAEWTAGQRLAWMARYSTGFAPGPYDQLAAALRRDGREQEARQVLLVRERLRHRAMGRLGAVWGAVQNIGIGFGYRPVRALLWLVAVIVAGTGWFAVAGPLRAVKPGEAPTWDPFVYTLDVLVPLIDLGHDKAWDPVGADKVVTLTVMAIGWVLATTVIAGAGRALRR
jgi:hypothetical protein